VTYSRLECLVTLAQDQDIPIRVYDPMEEFALQRQKLPITARIKQVGRRHSDWNQ
jgi:hypothetical protein